MRSSGSSGMQVRTVALMKKGLRRSPLRRAARGHWVRTVALMKKGLRLAVIDPPDPVARVRTVALMKKGLRRFGSGCHPALPSSNSRPDEEGIKT